MNHKCLQCGDECRTIFVLKDEIWAKLVNDKKDVLCFTCAQNRMGRSFTWNDFKQDIGLTREMLLGLLIYDRSPWDEKQDMVRRVYVTKECQK